MEDLLDKGQIMVVVVMQGWILALVFGVGQSDGDAKTKY